MKPHIASLTIVCLALAAIPALAQSQFYENGPINGTTDAWTINFGFVVSDTFFTNNYNTVTGFSIGAWEFPGDTTLTIDYSITDGENSPCPSDECLSSGTASVTDTFVSSNQFGFNIDTLTASGLSVQVPEGVTLWLNLQNAVVNSGDPVYWDENSGAGCNSPECPSSASENTVGTTPSEAFTLYGNQSETCGGGNSPCGPTTPEPSSILLFGSGILGLAGVLRCKLHF